jgi:glutathione synthase/RimK-type ligase-like ATP-grasp enzyme
MILVCGGLADRVTELVCARLEQMGFSYRLMNLGLYPKGYEVHWHWSAGGRTSGAISTNDWTLDLSAVRSVFVRFVSNEARELPQGVDGNLAAAAGAECDSQLAALIETLPCLVVNRMAGGFSNHSKPYQSLLIRQSGLQIPATCITNDPAAALDFYHQHQGKVIYKSISGVRSIVRRLTPQMLDRLAFLRHGPAQFQALVEGHDVRVHVVGQTCFATRIRSESVDYRYASREGGSAVMEPDQLPESVERACIALTASLGLVLSGIDLKLTPEGQYYCFEVNPAPGFMCYEQATGQPISSALAQLLHAGATTNRINGHASLPVGQPRTVRDATMATEQAAAAHG